MRQSEAWIGFLVMAFAVLGLIGAFAVVAAQEPFGHAMARNATLDAALAASRAANPAAAVQALRLALGDSATAVLSGQGDIAARIDGERARMLNRFYAESQDIGVRLRVVIAGFTVTAALFGVFVVGVLRRSTDIPAPGPPLLRS